MTDTPFVRPDVARFLAFLNDAPGPRMHELDPPAARAMTRAARAVADLDRGEIAVVRDTACPGPAGDLPLRLYDMREARLPGPVVLFFHGGGFVIGDLDSHDAACAEIARMLDLPVVAVDYRLAPEAAWPAAPDDCEAAARFVASGAMAGVKPTGLVFIGDSAGGNLCIVTALALRDAPAAVPVLAQFPLYPLTDTNTRRPSLDLFAEGYFLTRDGMRWFDRAYAADNAHVRTSPMLADQAGMPPTLVLTAGLDPLRDQGRAYAAQLIEAGVPTVFREAVGNIHGFLTMRRAIPSSQGDLAGALVALKAMIVEAEATAVMAQAAGAGA